MQSNNQFIEVSPDERIICVNVSKSVKDSAGCDIFGCARRYWRVDVTRAEKADLVLALNHGIVVGVFRPLRWFKTANPQYAGRYEFEGEMVEESPYFGKCVWNIISKRTQSFAYINL